ncbi:MAG: M48 family metalloprotease [candidate division Zixibacteria bacterium]|nr:M48 family metalloprotease [candidate division Zixibacteria bacterium]
MTPKYWKLSLLAAVLMALPLFSGCATTGPGGQKSFILISDQEEIAIGGQVDAEVRKTNKVLHDSAWQSYLTEVGEKIVKVCDRPELQYHFTVIESDQINAFATPGGYVFFYTGILRLMDNEAEMAAVMAHEISHVVGRHSVKHLQIAYGGAIGLQLILGDQSGKLAGELVATAMGIALTGYGRSHELEADKFGVYYMQKAGFNPGGARTMFEKLSHLSGEAKRGFFENLTATHPDTQDRLSRIDSEIAGMPRTVDALPLNKARYQKMKSRLPPPADTTSTKP